MGLVVFITPPRNIFKISGTNHPQLRRVCHLDDVAYRWGRTVKSGFVFDHLDVDPEHNDFGKRHCLTARPIGLDYCRRPEISAAYPNLTFLYFWRKPV